MSEDNEYLDEFKGRFSSIPPNFRAALILAVPIILVAIWNSVTSGVGTCLSAILSIAFYAAAGILTVKFSKDDGVSVDQPFRTGAVGGLSLWAIDAATSVIVSLITGGLTAGATIILGIPFLCVCLPGLLIFSAGMGGLGGWLYGKYFRPTANEEGDSEY